MVMGGFLKSFIFFAVGFFFLTSLAVASDAIRSELLKTPVHNYKNYAFSPNSFMVSRVSKTPEFVLQYLKDMDKEESYASYMPTSDELKLIDSYIKLLPGANQKAMQDTLLGIYFVKNFKGSGFTDFVLDEEGRIYTILILHPDTLRVGFEEWVNLKEGSAFLDDDESVSVKVKCKSDYVGLLYILLHESTHILDYTTPITPYPEPNIKEVRGGAESPYKNEFTKGVWAEYDKPIKKYVRSYDGKVSFYGLGGDPKLKLSQASKIYKELSSTQFSSLYATQNWAEDLAEFVTWYHYTQVLGGDYEIVVSKEGKELFSYKPFTNPLVKDRNYSAFDHRR